MKKAFLLATGLLIAPALLSAADAVEAFESNCASCHGKDGVGATRAGRTAGVEDFTDPAYQAKFTDEEAIARIKEGLTDEKTGKERMKSYSDKLTEEEMVAVVAYIRAFAKN